MSFVATLVSPANVTLTHDITSLACSALPLVSETSTLAQNRAIDIFFQGGMKEADPKITAQQHEAELRQALSGLPLDIFVQPTHNRRKKLLIADMDSTMIGQECIDELADEVGLKEHVAAITERAMRGEIAFEPALKERVALLKGLDVSVIKKMLDTRITLTEGAQALVQTMRKKGGYALLVSGGFTLFTQEVASKIGFDENRANKLNVSGSKLTGDVAEPILGKEAKRQALLEACAAQGVSPEDAVAIGDGANDLAMITEAGLGVAYHAKPAVAAAARARIEHTDLATVLYYQGYRRVDFADVDL